MVMTTLTGILLKPFTLPLRVERWWLGLDLSRKRRALLETIGIVLFTHGFLIVFVPIARWLGLKPGVDFRPAPTFRGSYLVSEILLLTIAFLFYRTRVKRG